MVEVERSKPWSKRGARVAMAVIAGLLWSQYSGDIARLLAPDGIPGLPFGRAILASLSDMIAMTVLVCVAANIGIRYIPWLYGLAAPMGRPLLMVGAPVAIAAIICVLLVPVAAALDPWAIGWRGVGGPLAEEIVYRALSVGALMRLAGWRFVPAVLLPAVVFGLAHAAEGESLAESGAIVAITAVGGLFFGWLFVRWGFNLWPAILAHAGLNTLWEVFAFGETAIGDGFGNLLRLGLVALVLVATYCFAPKTNTA